MNLLNKAAKTKQTNKNCNGPFLTNIFRNFTRNLFSYVKNKQTKNAKMTISHMFGTISFLKIVHIGICGGNVPRVFQNLG